MSLLPEPGDGPTGRQRVEDASQTPHSSQEEMSDTTIGEPITTEVWTEIETSLTNIKEGLEKEGVGLQYLNELANIIDYVSLASRLRTADGIET